MVSTFFFDVITFWVATLWLDARSPKLNYCIVFDKQEFIHGKIAVRNRSRYLHAQALSFSGHLISKCR